MPVRELGRGRHKPGVARQHADAEKVTQAVIRVRRRRLDPSGRVVADARDAIENKTYDQLGDRHLVARESAGLVGADHVGGAECLDGAQPFDERFLFRERARGGGERRVDLGRTPLGIRAHANPTANSIASLIGRSACTAITSTTIETAPTP